MADSNATELHTTLCAMLTEFEDAAMAIRVEAFDTQAREEVWRNAIGDLAREYATEIEGMYTPEQAVTATLGYEANPNGLPVGLTISDDGTLLNWRGENYVKQSRLGGGTLTANDVLNAVYKHGARWQAIADELNATLGAGECKVVMSFTDGLCTDNPKHWFKLSCGHSFMVDGLSKPVACAVCGKAVS